MADFLDKEGKVIEPHDADGNPIEVFNKEELDAAVQEKVDEAKAEAEVAKTELDDKIEELEEEVKKKEEEMGGDDKKKNFKTLRESRDQAQKDLDETKEALEDLKKTTEEKITGITKAVSEKKVDDAIKEFAGGDEELAKKVKFHFLNFKPDEETDPTKREENFKERIKNAFTLAGGGTPADKVPGVAGTGSGHIPPAPTGTPPKGLTKDAEDMGKQKMGVTDEDIEAYKKAKGIK